MKLIFMLKSGAVQWEVPVENREAFNFNSVMTNFRMCGFFMSNDLYVRHEEVVGIIWDKGSDHKPPTHTEQFGGSVLQ